MKPQFSILIIMGVCISSLLPMTSANPFLISIQSSDAVNPTLRLQNTYEVHEYVQLSINLNNLFTTVKTVVLSIAFRDASDQLLGTTASTVSLQPRQTSVIIPPPFTIPQRAQRGEATAEINVYTTWPQAGGVPYCPEHRVHFTIRNLAATVPPNTQSSETPMGLDDASTSALPPTPPIDRADDSPEASESTTTSEMTRPEDDEVNPVSARETHGGFVESCDTFDPTVWDHYYSPPVAVGDGTWLFEFPAGQARTYNAVWREYTHYGTYTLRFKVSWRRPVRGLRWYSMFLFGQSLNEVDIPEMLSWGNTGPQTSSIAIHPYDADGNKILNPHEPDGKWYWIFESTVDYEDGDWHVWETTYTPTRIMLTIDGIHQYTVTNTQDPLWDVSGFNWFPTIGDMQLIVGGGFDGSQSTTHRLIVDEVTYTPLPVEL
jgi:hypothetical protein